MKLLSLISLLCISLLTTPIAMAREVSLGLSATQGVDRYEQESEVLGNMDHAAVYWTLGSFATHPYDRFRGNYDILLILKIPKVEGSLLAAILEGHYDDDLRKLGQLIKQDGRPITIRPLYEGNGDWYAWHAYKKPNRPEDFAPAFRHIVTLIREQADGLVRFDQNYNRKSANGKTNDFAQLYAGDDYVDQVTISSYNRCGTSPSHTKAKSFAEEFRPAYEKLTTITSKPIGVAETATTDKCGVNRIEWYRDMLNAIQDEFTRVEHVTFFFESIAPGLASNTKQINWQLYKEEKPEFRALIDDFRAAGFAKSHTTSHAIKKKRKSSPGKHKIESQGQEHSNAATNTRVTKTQAVQAHNNRVELAAGEEIVDELITVDVADETPTTLNRTKAIKTTRTGTCPPPKKMKKIKRTVQEPTCGQPSTPWSVYMRAEHFMTETENPALNTVTGDQFGYIGSRIRANANQAVIWDLGNGKSFGPQFTVGGVVSSNNNQWWNNQVSAKADVRFCQESAEQWGKTCVFTGVGRIEYLGKTPEIYDRNTLIGRSAENQVYIGVESSFGGNWSQ
ncbi:glycoside hydrolase family 26 protein [Thiofilum flexile]|uniref:glycoside hydrolase family 26 protein n=1 Tax=Thiofilum flexile TaxID=125627 RepID=UPI000375E225|nr:glycosyl hydrolase [Thiofilum flexile]